MAFVTFRKLIGSCVILGRESLQSLTNLMIKGYISQKYYWYSFNEGGTCKLKYFAECRCSHSFVIITRSLHRMSLSVQLLSWCSCFSIVSHVSDLYSKQSKVIHKYSSFHHASYVVVTSTNPSLLVLLLLNCSTMCQGVVARFILKVKDKICLN